MSHAQVFDYVLGLDALGDPAQDERPRKLDDGAHNGGVVAIEDHVPHEILVDFHFVERKAFEAGKAAVARSKIVQ